MKENISSTALWNNAGGAGVVLGLVSIAYMTITQMIASIQSVWILNLFVFLLWAAKFVGCIYLMRFFMQRLSDKFADVTNSTTFRFGVITSLCSALLFSGAMLFNLLVISPDSVSEAMDTARQMYGNILDSNSRVVLDRLESILPQITFFTYLIYCFIYGTVLSAILSRYIPKQDPFANYTDESGISKNEQA